MAAPRTVQDDDAAGFNAPDGRPVLFLAHPGLAPPDGIHAYARPDDPAGDGRTWRARLLAYNEQPQDNPLGLLPAGALYVHDAYRALVARFGLPNVFILSAGWGLIPASFLTPAYDITFTAAADPWKRRRKDERYEDFSLMPDDGRDSLFLGGKDYLPLFCKLTAPLAGRKIVFSSAGRPPDLPRGFAVERYAASTRTNWHYECARDLVAGRIAGFAG